ncbi:cyclophilin-like fold protein [Cohaesibacter marisflavi]|uniref:cyclophilin-like fold protein n=1 Tax=Cohaesibacter marisflavi TaxID=655353 RepID=UPI0029C93F5B|nr:cyclophilin-like fold protein [Cohaesibacter marisflavi]
MTTSSISFISRNGSALGIGFAMMLALTAPSMALPASAEGARVRFILANTTLTATLEDNSASRDFLAMLPVDVTLEDYASNEKIFYPEEKLSTTDVPDGIDPEPGDITYYAPWGDVALFYRDFRYSAGLVRLGRFDEGAIKALSKSGSLKARIEAIK